MRAVADLYGIQILVLMICLQPDGQVPKPEEDEVSY
jgi:hypothetical protein